MPTDRKPQSVPTVPAPSAAAAVALAEARVPVPRAPRPAPGDPRVTELRAAAAWLGHELSRVAPPDRRAAEAELAALDRRLDRGTLTAGDLSGPLLALAGALGSVSALAPAFGAFRQAVEAF